jgi:hypothetical protein
MARGDLIAYFALRFTAEGLPRFSLISNSICRPSSSELSPADSTRPGVLKLRSVDNSRLMGGSDLDVYRGAAQGVDHG